MKKSIWILLLLAWGCMAKCQEQDIRLWTSVSARYDLNKKWTAVLEEEARFKENISRLDRLNSELSVDYQINKILNAGLLYRLITAGNPDGSFDFGHRFGAYLEAQKKISGWTGSIKGSFQSTYPRFGSSEGWYIPENYVRLLAEVSKELKNKKTEPYASMELFYRLRAGEQSFADQYRFTAGIQHKLNKKNRLDIYYRLQREMQVRNPLTAHIIGIGYRFRFR